MKNFLDGAREGDAAGDNGADQGPSDNDRLAGAGLIEANGDKPIPEWKELYNQPGLLDKAVDKLGNLAASKVQGKQVEAVQTGSHLGGIGWTATAAVVDAVFDRNKE
jgi:hypothetical protein